METIPPWCHRGAEVVCVTSKPWYNMWTGAPLRAYVPQFMHTYHVDRVFTHQQLKIIGIALDELPHQIWTLYNQETGQLKFQPVIKLDSKTELEVERSLFRERKITEPA